MIPFSWNTLLIHTQKSRTRNLTSYSSVPTDFPSSVPSYRSKHSLFHSWTSLLVFMLVSIIIWLLLMAQIWKICFLFSTQCRIHQQIPFIFSQLLSLSFSLLLFCMTCLGQVYLSPEMTWGPLEGFLVSTALPSILLPQDGQKDLIKMQIRPCHDSPETPKVIL